MSEARKEILGRIRAALGDVAPGERAADVEVPRDYVRSDDRSRTDLVQRFAERVRDYHAEVEQVDDVGAAVSEACSRLGLRRIVVPPALPDAWRPHGVEVTEDQGLSAGQLDEFDGALTGCACAIAETGTVALDGRERSGRRLLTLVPDHHICVVEIDQLVGLVPEAIARLAPAVRDAGAPITLVSGPSASSDIELSRVEGVHGPRHLLVLIVPKVGLQPEDRSD